MDESFEYNMAASVAQAIMIWLAFDAQRLRTAPDLTLAQRWKWSSRCRIDESRALGEFEITELSTLDYLRVIARRARGFQQEMHFRATP